MLQVEKHRLSIGLYIMAVAGVLETRIKNTYHEGTEITELFEPQMKINVKKLNCLNLDTNTEIET